MYPAGAPGGLSLGGFEVDAWPLPYLAVWLPAALVLLVGASLSVTLSPAALRLTVPSVAVWVWGQHAQLSPQSSATLSFVAQGAAVFGLFCAAASLRSWTPLLLAIACAARTALQGLALFSLQVSTAANFDPDSWIGMVVWVRLLELVCAAAGSAAIALPVVRRRPVAIRALAAELSGPGCLSP